MLLLPALALAPVPAELEAAGAADDPDPAAADDPEPAAAAALEGMESVAVLTAVVETAEAVL